MKTASSYSTFFRILSAGLPLLCGILACDSSTVRCTRGLSRCGIGCADFSVDKFNCGACRNVCQPTQMCASGQCQCLPGATVCDGVCTFTQYSSRHCGGCAGDGGVTCSADQVCQSGRCASSCAVGYSLCDGGSCLNLQSDPNNCSACGLQCPRNANCRAGQCTYDLVATCASAGSVFGVQSPADVTSGLVALGNSPRALGVSGGVLLAADDQDNILYQARVVDFSPLGGAKRLAPGARQVLVSAPFVYVLSDQANALHIFQLDAGDVVDAGVVLPDGGPPGSSDGGAPWSLGLQSRYALDAGVAPQTVAASGSSLYVTFYGGPADAGALAATGVIAQLDTSNPSLPTLVQTIALDGGGEFARPTGIVAHAGSVYAAVANLSATDVPDAGVLAKINPTTGAVSLVGLGSDCLRPQWITELGDSLLVSCAGNILTDGGTTGGAPPIPSAMVLVDGSDRAGVAWKVSCPPGPVSCRTPLLSRFALVGNRVYAGDLVDGRLFVAEVDGGQLVERRGLAIDAGPIPACPGTGITDVVTVP